MIRLLTLCQAYPFTMVLFPSKIRRLLKHLAFWLFILAFQISRSGSKIIDTNLHDFRSLLIEHSLMLPLLVIISYFFAYYLLPRFLSASRYLPLFLLAICSGAFAIIMMRVILYFYVFPEFYPAYYEKYPGFWNFNLAQYTFYIFSTVAIVVMIKYASQLRRVERIRYQLEQQNLSSELALLRSQVNPHFLFNTLNNINVLVKKDPELTQKSIVKLSEIMRYMLIEAVNEKILLTREIEYLNNYIGLLSLRLEQSGYIRFTVTGEGQGVFIPPMLLVPFIENAFKHGFKDAPAPGIVVQLGIAEDKILYCVENFINPNKISDTPDSNGLGMANLKRRLGLLYPGKHKLEIHTDGKTYRCKLELEIDK